MSTSVECDVGVGDMLSIGGPRKVDGVDGTQGSVTATQPSSRQEKKQDVKKAERIIRIVKYHVTRMMHNIECTSPVNG